MKRTLRTFVRMYHVPKDGTKKFLSNEDNIFREVQEALSTQYNVKQVVITITNPNYICNESSENNKPYTVDMHYRHKRYLHTLEGSECEPIVREAIGWIYQQPDETH